MNDFNYINSPQYMDSMENVHLFIMDFNSEKLRAYVVGCRSGYFLLDLIYDLDLD